MKSGLIVGTRYFRSTKCSTKFSKPVQSSLPVTPRTRDGHFLASGLAWRSIADWVLGVQALHVVDRTRLRRTTYYTDVFLVVLRTYRTVLVRTLWWACMSRCGSAIGDPKVHVRIGEFWDLDFFLGNDAGLHVLYRRVNNTIFFRIVQRTYFFQRLAACIFEMREKSGTLKH